MRVWLICDRDDQDSYGTKRFLTTGRQYGIDVRVIVPEDVDIVVTQGTQSSIHIHGTKTDLPDAVIPRTGSGTNYHTLAIMRQLERLGVFVLNDSRSIELSKDKMASMQLLAKNNIPLPKTMLAKFPVDIPFVEEEFAYPFVLKSNPGTHGKGVILVKERKQIEELLSMIQPLETSETNLIIQEFMKKSKGRDVRVFVVGGKPIGAMLRTAKPGDFRANIHAGGKPARFEVTPELSRLSKKIVKLKNMEIAGIDYLFDSKGFRVCEVNSAPGFEGFEEATELDVPVIIFKYIKKSLKLKEPDFKPKSFF